MTSSELETLICRSLDNFYERRINKLSGLKLRDALKKKNPYLFRAVGIKGAPEIVERLLGDYMSSSDEGIFGDAFFEPISKLISLMRDYPTKHRIQFDEEWAKAINRFVRDFTVDFATPEGSMDWGKLARFNGGVELMRFPVSRVQKSKLP